MKKCILYDDRICNDCGECQRCDLDPSKICDNCGKCLVKNDEEFRSVVLRAEELNDTMHMEGSGNDDEPEYSDAEMEERERLLDEFLDLPIDLHLPEPIQIDPELVEKWERILADYEDKERENEAPDEPEPEIKLRGVRKRRHK